MVGCFCFSGGACTITEFRFHNTQPPSHESDETEVEEGIGGGGGDATLNPQAISKIHVQIKAALFEMRVHCAIT